MLSRMPVQTPSPSDIETKRSFTAVIQKKMARDNVTISALAKRMGTGRTAVRRMLDTNNTSITFRSMSRIARAVGLEIRLVAEPMSPDDLGKLAHRVAGSKSRAEAGELADEITKGFYAGS
jgi:DNA-binding phage protein